MFRTVLTAVALAACAGAAPAQPSTAPMPTYVDPLDARAVVPAARATAPLESYRRHTSVEVQPGSWRAANDNVNRIGGWRTYAREAQASGPATGAPAANTAGPAAATAGPTQQPTPAASLPRAPAATPPATSPATPPATGPAPSAPAHRH